MRCEVVAWLLQLRPLREVALGTIGVWRRPACVYVCVNKCMCVFVYTNGCSVVYVYAHEPILYMYTHRIVYVYAQEPTDIQYCLCIQIYSIVYVYRHTVLFMYTRYSIVYVYRYTVLYMYTDIQYCICTRTRADRYSH